MMTRHHSPADQPGLFETLKPDKTITTVFWSVLDQLRQMSLGLNAAQQWELHLRLSHELYSRAVNGWALLNTEIGRGEGI